MQRRDVCSWQWIEQVNRVWSDLGQWQLGIRNEIYCPGYLLCNVSSCLLESRNFTCSDGVLVVCLVGQGIEVGVVVVLESLLKVEPWIGDRRCIHRVVRHRAPLHWKTFHKGIGVPICPTRVVSSSLYNCIRKRVTSRWRNWKVQGHGWNTIVTTSVATTILNLQSNGCDYSPGLCWQSSYGYGGHCCTLSSWWTWWSWWLGLKWKGKISMIHRHPPTPQNAKNQYRRSQTKNDIMLC